MTSRTDGPISTVLVGDHLLCGPVQVIGSRVEDDGAGPDSLQLLDHQRVSKESLRLCPDGDFQRRYTGHSWLMPKDGRRIPIGTRGSSATVGSRKALQWIEIIRQGI